MCFYGSDIDPVYSLVHVDVIIAVGTTWTTSGYAELRPIRGDTILAKDTGSLNHEGSKLHALVRILTRVGDEVHVQSWAGCIDGLLEILRLSRANG